MSMFSASPAHRCPSVVLEFSEEVQSAPRTEFTEGWMSDSGACASALLVAGVLVTLITEVSGLRTDLTRPHRASNDVRVRQELDCSSKASRLHCAAC